ncbi:DUF4352 domain-containing protein [Carnobacterium maltaromaticum]|uniref:DUF4352 domain-containing protein n=1 Tax=Carnobacterium maltaromaticum TaxID=2751 RepID=UPI0039AFDF00
MKKINIILCFIIFFFLTACSSNSTISPKDKKLSETEQKFKTKTVQNIEMKLKNIETTESGNDEKQNIVVFTMKFQNIDSTVIGIGGGDFKIKADDKIYSIYAEGNNIGQEIEQEKTADGKLYFELPTSVKKATLQYIPGDKILGKWDVKIPEAK